MIFCKNRSLLSLTKIASVVLTCFLSSFGNANTDSHSVEYEKLMGTYTDDKHYNDVCWLTSHNSFAYSDPSISNKFIPGNQWLSIKGQLEYGVRGFMVDLYYKHDDPNDTIILAHRFQPEPAIWNRRYFKQDFLTPFLSTIKTWLDDPLNQNDIITIHLESYIKNYSKIIDAIKTTGLYEHLFDLCEYNNGSWGQTKCYLQNEKKLQLMELRWPTLGEMREKINNKDKRLVIFSDKSQDAGYGIIHVSNTMETEYNLAEFHVCEKRSEDRGQNAPVFIMNHFYKYMAIPAADFIWGYSAKANKYGTLLLRSGACCLQENKCPNFIAIDHVGLDGSGDRQVVLTINEHNTACHCTVKDYPYTDNSANSVKCSPKIYQDASCSKLDADLSFLQFLAQIHRDLFYLQ